MARAFATSHCLVGGKLELCRKFHLCGSLDLWLAEICWLLLKFQGWCPFGQRIRIRLLSVGTVCEMFCWGWRSSPSLDGHSLARWAEWRCEGLCQLSCEAFDLPSWACLASCSRTSISHNPLTLIWLASSGWMSAFHWRYPWSGLKEKLKVLSAWT